MSVLEFSGLTICISVDGSQQGMEGSSKGHVRIKESHYSKHAVSFRVSNSYFKDKKTRELIYMKKQI